MYLDNGNYDITDNAITVGLLNSLLIELSLPLNCLFLFLNPSCDGASQTFQPQVRGTPDWLQHKPKKLVEYWTEY